MNDLVSVIMPSYNTAQFIKDSICSVLNQTYKNFELIIIDDSSTDNTKEIVKLIKDKRIRFYALRYNHGASYARNLALRKARGRWIAFLDSDDMWESSKLEKQIQFMEEHKYAFTYTNYIEVMENKNVKLVSGPRVINKKMMYAYCWLGCLTVMYDREKIGLIQIESIRKNNDYAMWLKAVRKSECHLLNISLAKYRRGRKGSICSENIFKMIRYHYLLFRICERKAILSSLIFTCLNLIFGAYKKIVYTKKL